MARRCQVTGVGPVAGHSISHAHNKTKRRFLPNLQKKRIWVKELGRFVTVKLSTSAIKTLSKNGTSDLAKLVIDKKIKVR
jgi:large subunit ribosomal protein L28